MGKITDAAIAIIVLVIGLWILTRMGLDLASIEAMFRKFLFGGSPGTTNATSAIISAIGGKWR
ncbi:MAG: hypothetical protein ACYCT2_04755 [Thermoplasmataceae archaeon]